MKNKLIFLPCILFITSGLLGQDKKRTWVARANIGAFLSITNVSIEKAFSNRSSVSLVPSFGYFRSEQFTYKTVGIGTEYRYYFQKQKIAPQGYYAAAGASYANGKADIETKSEIFDVKGYTTKLVAGKHWIFKKGFVIDAHLGVQYIDLDVKGRTATINNKPVEQNYKWLLPAFGAGIGYAF